MRRVSPANLVSWTDVSLFLQNGQTMHLKGNLRVGLLL